MVGHFIGFLQIYLYLTLYLPGYFHTLFVQEGGGKFAPPYQKTVW